MVDKLNLPSKANDVQNKINEIIDNIPSYSEGTGISLDNNFISIVQQSETTYNYIKVGNLTNDNGLLSGFSLSNYAKTIPEDFSDYTSTANTWEMVWKFRFGTPTETYYEKTQVIYGQGVRYGTMFGTKDTKLFMGISNSSSETSIGGAIGTTTLTIGSIYWYKAEFTGSAYNMYLSTDGSTWNLEDTIISSTKISPRGSWTIGYTANPDSDIYKYPWQGAIDLLGCYIKVNGDFLWQGATTIGGGVVAKATDNLYGLVKPDGTSISVNNGVISAVNNGTVTSVNGTTPDASGNVSLAIPSINSTNNYVPYRSGASSFANSTLMYNSNAMAFTGNLHVGSSSPSSYYDKGRFTIYDNTASQQVTSMALLNYGGGGGCGVAIDMYNTSANGGIPSGRFGVVDNGNYSGYLQLQVKKSGSQSNPLLPAMNIVPVPATSSLTTCVSFGQDEFNRVLFDLHKPEATVTITDTDKRWGGSGTTYSVTGSNKFNSRLLVAVGDIVSFDSFSTEATVTGVVSNSTTCQITTNVSLGTISNKNISVKKAYFKVTDENNNTKVIIDPYGKMGIGKLTPAYDLDVAGTINASSDIKINGSSVALASSVPTKISDLTDDTETFPIDEAYTLTGLTASITELNYTNGVTSNIQTQFDTINKGYVSNGSILPTDYSNIKYYYNLSFDESKFTKVGTPTIIDGVASGFSASNFFTLTTSISASTSLKYTLKFTTPASLSTNQPIVALRNSDSSNYIDMWIRSGALMLRAYTGTNVNKSFTISANTTYYAQIEYSGGTWTGRISTDGSTWTEQTLGTAPILAAIVNTAIGRYSGTTFEGSVDLKTFEIVADGTLAFTGKKDGTDTYNINNVTVLIPYTVCKIGRIVDSSYRTTLDTIYTNYGYVPYYTLDTTNQNYTLPKGEVFGLMSIISKNAIQDS